MKRAMEKGLKTFNGKTSARLERQQEALMLGFLFWFAECIHSE